MINRYLLFASSFIGNQMTEEACGSRDILVIVTKKLCRLPIESGANPISIEYEWNESRIR